MATATALPKRSEVRVEDTWNLEAIYPSVEAWEADFQRVTGMLEGIRAGQGTLGELGAGAAAGPAAPRRCWRDPRSPLRLRPHALAPGHRQEPVSGAGRPRRPRSRASSNAAGSYMTPEILAIPQEKLDAFLAEEPKLQVYRHALDEINRERPHILSAEMEALLAQADEMGNAAERIFEMLNYADLKLPKCP